MCFQVTRGIAALLLTISTTGVTVGEEFSIDTIRPQSGWIVEGTVAPGEWKPVVQPNLAEQIQDASRLKLKDVAPPPERCWVGHRPYLVPNPDGKSWDMIYPYYNKYRGVQKVVIHDFGSGETRRQVVSTGEGDSVLTREPIGFHMQPSFYTEGKLIFETYGAVVFVVYDPAVDRFIDGVKPFGDEVVNGRCVLGDDGKIYGMGWPKDKSGFVAYCFNPKNHEARRFKTFGPPNEHRRELYREVRMFGDWIYAAIGAQPRHLVAFNFRTGEGRLLGATKEIIGDGNTIALTRMKGGFSGTIRNATSIRGIDDFGRDKFAFWLHDGKVYPRAGDIPPWSDTPAEENPAARYNWPREFQVWPRGFVPPSPPPLIENDSADPDAQGRVELRYQPGGQEEWKTLQYDVQMYPGIVRLLTEINDHVLFATDEGYGQHVFYNLTSNQLERVGGTLSPYSFGLCRDRLYVSGYPGSPVTAFSQVRRQAFSFRRGPNGYIWTFFDKTLVRIDPRNARVQPIGRTEPAQLAFAAGGVYIAGGPMLRRIEGIAVGKR